MIEKNDFLKIINLTPLVSIDLILKDESGNYLLGKRLNRPAQGYWFVPGGRIKKNEKIADAMIRISSTETGIEIPLSKTHLLGTFDHIYDDNCFSEKGINTHYVVLAYSANLSNSATFKIDDQHSELKWWSKDDILTSPDVHPNTKAYFTKT